MTTPTRRDPFLEAGTNAETNRVDVVVSRTGSLHQATRLADRLRVPLRFGWRQVFRWAGRAVLAAGVPLAQGEELVRSAQGVGLKSWTAPEQTHGFLYRNARWLGRAIGLTAALGEFSWVWLYDHHMPLGHFLGFLWINLVSHDLALFEWVKRVAALLASVGVGLFAMALFFSVLARLRLTRPLLEGAPALVAAAPAAALPSLPPSRSLRPTLVLAGLMAVGVLWAAILGLRRAWLPAASQPPAKVAAAAPLPLSPIKARATLRDELRPRPDQRFLRAVADVQEVLRGPPRLEVEARFAEGRWFVMQDGLEVGELPEQPDFDDGLSLVRNWAARLGAATTLSMVKSNPLPQLDEESLTSLRALQRRWDAGARTTDLAHQGAILLASLSLEATDAAGVGDALPARALALLAIDEAAGRGRAPLTEAILAEAMGYTRAARKAAATLAPDDATRAFIFHSDEKQLFRTGGLPWNRFLWSRRLSALRQHETEAEWLEEELQQTPGRVATMRTRLTQKSDLVAASVRDSLPGVQAALEREVSEEQADPAARLSLFSQAAIRVSSLAAPLDGAPWTARGLLPAFERVLAKAGSTGAGPFYDPAIVQAYYAGAMDSGVLVATRELKRNGSQEALRALVTSFGAPTRAAERDLVRWANGFIRPNSGIEYMQDRGSISELLGTLQLGAEPLEELFDVLPADASSGTLTKLQAARILVSRLGTRPADLPALYRVAWWSLLDAPLAERSCLGLLETSTSSNPGGEGYCAAYLGDRERVLQLIRSSDLETYQRSQLAALLERRHLAEPAEVDAEFKLLLPLEDGWARVIGPYSEILEARKDHEGARALIRGWLGLRPGSSVISLNLQVDSARLLEREGKYQEAWEELQPALASERAVGRDRGALVLSDLGRSAEAIKMARELLAARPGWWNAYDVQLEVLWRAGNHGEAAQAVRQPPWHVELADYRLHAGEAFARAFEGREGEMVAAFTVLREAHVQEQALRELASAVRSKEAAFKLLAPLCEQGDRDASTVALAAGFLRAARGEAAAADWLALHQPASTLDLAAALYGGGETALLWSVPEGADAEYLWLLRAAGALLDHAPERAELKAHLAKSGSTELRAITAYLAGALDEKSLLALATNPDSAKRVAYFFAVRAQGEGRLADASAWYQVVLLGQGNQGREFRWAHAQLRRWSAEESSLTQLQRRASRH